MKAVVEKLIRDVAQPSDRRYRLTAYSYRHARADAFSLWADYAREMTA